MPALVALTGSTVGGSVTVNVDARARRAAAAVVVVRRDPGADAAFVGRVTELTELLGLLAPHGEAGGTARGTVAVAGAPGVGKTVLAQTAARAAVVRGWFPGGAVSVDMHGYDPDPTLVVWPAQLYAGLVRALGVAGEQVPPSESEQATAYHQLLDQCADAGRAVLLVWDNVADPEQVTALLPRGGSGHRVLITSRDTLGQLPDTRLLDLHVLEPAAGVELLAAGLRRRRPGDERVAVEPDPAARLVELCGRLPLAVQIVAALLGDEPDRPLSEMADELAEEGTRLRGLDYSQRWAVRAAFDLSYHRLDPPTAQLFRWLAAAPGTDVGLEVAAVVADRTQPETRIGLRALCRAHLLEQSSDPPGQAPRWRMHDLIRLYAAERLTTGELAAGFARVLVHYRLTSDLAERRFTALPADLASVPAGFGTPQEAMAWVLQERAGLIACVARASDSHPEDSVLLAAHLAPFLRRARLLEDGVTAATAAVHAAGSVDDPAVAAGSWNNLGLALWAVRRFDEAIAAHRRAVRIYQHVGDVQGEGQAWNNLGNALREVRRFEEAIAAHQQDLVICRETGDLNGEAAAWSNLGNGLREVRRFREAIAAYERAGEIYRETGDRHGEGQACTNLGIALREVRRFDLAVMAHERAGEAFRETGDRHGEGTAWNNLGNTLQEVHRFDEAIAAYERAGEIYRETGDRHGDGATWNNLGAVLGKVRRLDEAIAAYERAGEIFREIGSRHGQGTAWNNLGTALQEVRRFDEAIAAHEGAGEIFREIADRYGEGQAWSNLGLALWEVRRFDEAITAHQRDATICAQLGDKYGQAQALRNLGLVHAELEDRASARQTWARAAELYTAVGAEEDAVRVRRRIADLDR